MRKLAYTVPEVAEQLGCSTWLIYRAIKNGQLPVLPPEMAGRRVLIPALALEDRLNGAATFRTTEP